MNSTISRLASACAQHAMKEFAFSLIFWVLVFMTAFSLVFPQHALAVQITPDEDTPVIMVYSLSGVLFYDRDHDMKVDDNSDWSIPNAVVELYMGDKKVDETKTNSYGQYSFTNLTPGNYSIRNTVTGNFTPLVGKVYSSVTNDQKVSGLGEPDVEKDSIFDVFLSSGDQAIGYNFAAYQYPIQLLSKRMLLASSPEFLVHAVPEPSTFVMLVCAGIIIGTGAVCRRSIRKK